MIDGTIDHLLADGWREYPDQFRTYARCFYKRFDTPTRCHGNDDKEGMQVEIAVSEHEGRQSLEMTLCGELPDGTWVKILNYILPDNVQEVVGMIPRLLSMWEKGATT